MIEIRRKRQRRHVRKSKYGKLFWAGRLLRRKPLKEIRTEQKGRETERRMKLEERKIRLEEERLKFEKEKRIERMPPRSIPEEREVYASPTEAKKRLEERLRKQFGGIPGVKIGD